MNQFFFYFLFDGNFKELSFLEFNYLIHGLKSTLDFNIILFSNDLLVIEFHDDFLSLIQILQKYSRLVSLTKECGLYYFSISYSAQDEFSQVLKQVLLQITNFHSKFKIPHGSAFKVEMVKRGILNEQLFNSYNRQKLIYSVADNFIKLFDVKADLKNEQVLITIILTPQKVVLGQRIFKPNRKLIMNRTPSNRPYFHSGSMNPLLIRAMINLALKHNYLPIENKPKRKFIFLDPFMGAGGIMMEAGTMGYETIGIELGYWMARGARMNLSDLVNTGYKSFFWTVIRSDSNMIPLKSNSIDLIVTDPPYGHSTILGGQKLEDLLHTVIRECFRVLKNNSRMVISIPSSVLVNFYQFKILEKISDRVHNSLTRIIYLVEK